MNSPLPGLIREIENWWLGHGQQIAGILVYGILIAGIIALVAAMSVDTRATLVSGLFGISYWLVLATIITSLMTGVLFAIYRSAMSRTAFFVSLSFFGLIGITSLALNLSSSHLRLESAMRIQVGADFVHIGGAMAPSLTDQLEAAVHPSVDLKRVVLSNDGGNVDQAVAAAAWFRRRNVKTAIIEGDCASACTIMALLMPERYLAQGASLGFHDLWGQRGREDVLAEAKADLFARFAANAIDLNAVADLFKGRQLIYPSRDYLLANGLISGCWSHQSAAPVTCSTK